MDKEASIGRNHRTCGGLRRFQTGYGLSNLVRFFDDGVNNVKMLRHRRACLLAALPFVLEMVDDDLYFCLIFTIGQSVRHHPSSITSAWISLSYKTIETEISRPGLSPYLRRLTVRLTVRQRTPQILHKTMGIQVAAISCPLARSLALASLLFSSSSYNQQQPQPSTSSADADARGKSS